jgi:hypothetical protein
MLHCRLHGGVPRNGNHLGEDAHHSVSLAKARAHRRPVCPPDHVVAGKARAQQAIRATDGKFLPGTLHPPHPDAHVRKALKIVERLMEKNAMRLVPDDPDADDVVPEPRGGPMEAPEAVPEPQAVATESGTEAPPESPPSAEQLLEELLAALLDDEPDEDGGPSLWSTIADRLPDRLYAALGDWLDERWQ